MKNLKPATIKLLRKIQTAIKDEPTQFHMGNWFATGEDLGMEVAACGTAACIGGWAIALTKALTPREAKQYAFNHTENNEELAREALGLHQYQAERLFYSPNWPGEFQGREQNDADQAIARIEHFIKTDGEE